KSIASRSASSIISGILFSMNTEKKVLENRLRRTLERRGYSLEKSRRRDRLAVDYGRYWVRDQNNNFVGNIPCIDTTYTRHGRSVSIEAVARWVDSMGQAVRSAKARGATNDHQAGQRPLESASLDRRAG